MKTISVKLNESIIHDLKKVSDIYNISYSDFIRKAIEQALEEKKKDFMFRMGNVPYATAKEEKEIIEELSKLTDDDLKIVRVEKIKI